MKLRVMLYRKGLFTRLDRESMGVNPHNREYVYLWRKVLDEMLIGMVGTNTSAVEHSIRWFNCKPGDVDYYISDTPDENGNYPEVMVDAREEFEEVCSLASLDPALVTKVANEVARKVKEEDAEHTG